MTNTRSLTPAVILLIIAIPTIEVVFKTQSAAPRGAIEVGVVGPMLPRH